MKCPSCGEEAILIRGTHEPDDFFCMKCGSKLATKCMWCGKRLLVNQDLCDCGRENPIAVRPEVGRPDKGRKAKTSIRIDSDILQQARDAAVAQEKTLGQWLEEAIQERIEREQDR